MILNKNKVFAYILPCLLLFSLGCKKELEFTFTGKVSDRNGNPISGLAILVQEDAGTFNSSYNTIGNSTTLSDGTYTVVVPRNQVNSYRISTNNDDFHTAEKILSFDDVGSGIDNVVNLATNKRSWVRFNILINDENQGITIQKLSGNSTCPDCCANALYLYEGITNESKICGADAGEYYRFMIQRHGVDSEIDSVLCPQLDTIEYDVQF